MSAGDALARGAKSAVFPPAKVTAEKWAAIWETEKEKPAKKKPLKKVWSK